MNVRIAVVSPPRPAAWFALCLASLLPISAASAQSYKGLATVQHVALLGDETGMQLEITSSQPITPQTRVLANPDRVVIDFPNAMPGRDLRGILARHGELKGVRVGLFENNPPTTRIVLDLNSPDSFQILPSGNTIVVKLGDASIESAADVQPMSTPEAEASQDLMSNASVTITRHPINPSVAAKKLEPARIVATNSVPAPVSVSPMPAAAQTGRRLDVNFQNGLLSIDADQATLSEVLYEVQLRTGAEVAIPAGAEKDKVVIKAGPGPTKEVMSALLNGSHFNFILVGSAQDENTIQRVMLTPKGAEIAQSPAPAPVSAEDAESESPQPPEVSQDGNMQGNQPARKPNRNAAAAATVGGPPNRTADGAETPPSEVEQ
jgi:AMIN domain